MSRTVTVTVIFALYIYLNLRALTSCLLYGGCRCVGLLLLEGGGGWSCVLDNVANGAVSVE